MTLKQQHYDAYVTTGQAGVDPGAPTESASAKLAKGNPYHRMLLKRVFPSERNSRILDLGCGHGALLSALKSKGYCNVAGIDTSLQQVELAHVLGIEEVQQGDAIEFLESQTMADVVCCFDLLEHLRPDEINLLLTKVYALLRPAGLLILHVPNGEGLFGQRIRYGDLTHETCFTPKSISQLLRPIGFQTIRCLEDKPLPHGFRSAIRRVVWDIGTLWPRLLLAAETGETGFVLSQNMLVVATKN